MAISGIAANQHPGEAGRTRLALTLGALGIVFADIGTSPIFAFRDVLGQMGGRIGGDEIMGVLSLAMWSLIIVVSIKYRSEEHTSELQSLMRISYAVFCLKKKNNTNEPPPSHYTYTT